MVMAALHYRIMLSIFANTVADARSSVAKV